LPTKKSGGISKVDLPAGGNQIRAEINGFNLDFLFENEKPLYIRRPKAPKDVSKR
jgi:hypothetical protein